MVKKLISVVQSKPLLSLIAHILLTLWWRRPLSYKNQSIGLLYKSMDRFLYDKSLRHERVKIPYMKI